ncbi:MAG: glutamyl-tRNA reductase [Austwickia sp.]|nr:glutamyl-tRNA reductase [Austwickia sp.]MBK9100278.1 glutamyl-tRNA reductase [Austwickia sp.]
MSVVIIGVSHHSAPIEVLERLALPADRVDVLVGALSRAENLTEVVVLATCNRVEVYAEAVTFHGAVTDITDALADVTGMPRPQLNDYLYVHYEDRAIAHAFRVATGLDSMAVGDPQILGQLRTALRRAQGAGRAGAELNALLQHALRVGKRAHAETALDRVSVSLVEAGLAAALPRIGPLAGAEVLIVGAGAMSSLAAQTVARAGCTRLAVANRTRQRGEQLAQLTGARHIPLSELGAAFATADLVFTCTGAVGHLIGADEVRRARAAAGAGDRPLLFVDLAMPRDVDPTCAQLPGVEVIGMSELAQALRTPVRLTDIDREPPAPALPAISSEPAQDAVQAVQDLVTVEVAGYLAGRRMQGVAPTVAALRQRAQLVVTAELERLDARLAGSSAADRAEMHRCVHRIVDKLLHTPTVRVKELAGAEHAGDYAHALRQLFDLDPYDVAAVSTTTGAPGPA